jgi:NADPH-dependent curcumin reductase CurA
MYQQHYQQSNRTHLTEEEIQNQNKGFLLKRKDYLGIDEHANTHPNRTYYYKRYHDLDEVIDTCTKKLQASLTFSLSLRILSYFAFD